MNGAVAPCKLVKTNQKFYICSDGTHTHALQKEAFRHRNVYSLFTRKLLHRRCLCTQKLLRAETSVREAVFCGQRPLPFGGSHLRLPSGPAGIRTTTGSLSALARPTPYQLSHRVAFSVREAMNTEKQLLHRSFDTEKILHRRNFVTDKCLQKETLRRNGFTYSSFHIENPLRRPALTLKETCVLHTDAFAHTHRSA